jgi:hypothetical protein
VGLLLREAAAVEEALIKELLVLEELVAELTVQTQMIPVRLLLHLLVQLLI